MCWPGRCDKEGSSSFSKKKQKSFANGERGPTQIGPRIQMSESSLVLLSKKELLS
jgi:hypothetical protein